MLHMFFEWIYTVKIACQTKFHVLDQRSLFRAFQRYAIAQFSIFFRRALYMYVLKWPVLNVGTPSLILEDEKSITVEIYKLFCCDQQVSIVALNRMTSTHIFWDPKISFTVIFANNDYFRTQFWVMSVRVNIIYKFEWHWLTFKNSILTSIVVTV